MRPDRRIKNEMLGAARSVFLAAAWTEAKLHNNGSSLELIQSTRQDHSTQPLPTSDAMIEVISTDRDKIRDFIDGLDRRFQSEYEAFKSRETERQESKAIFLKGQIQELSTGPQESRASLHQ